MPAVAARRKTVARPAKMADTPSGLSDAEVRNAILREFPFAGLMIVRHLYDAEGVGRYRVNWFRDSDMGPYIHQTRFLLISQNDRATIVHDATAARGQSR